MGGSELLGKVVNWLGLPGLVQEADYRASIAPILVSVRTSHLFTVVTVNGIDVYFERLTGRIDGIGFSPISGCIPASVRESVDSVLQPSAQQEPTHSKKRMRLGS